MKGGYYGQEIQESPVVEAVCEFRFTPDTVETVLLQLTEEVDIPQPAEVLDYLMCYPGLTDLLLPVCETTRHRFGPKAQLSLEVYHDPEIEDEYLTLYVREEEFEENVMQTIKEIRASYEKDLAGKSGWFLVTTDFRPPRCSRSYR